MARKDITGKTFGCWTAIEYAHSNKDGDAYWLCRCSCGQTKVVKAEYLRNGESSSCGCYAGEVHRERLTKHGGRGKPEYRIWKAMKARSYNHHDKNYPRYGGRGVVVCSEWRESFEVFYLDMGPRPSPKHSIGRIDNDGPYSPGSCRWETPQQQSNNKSNNRLLTLNGRTLTATQWANEIGVSGKVISQRLKLGWTIEEALTTPALPASTHKIRTKLTKDMIETLGQLIDNGTSYTAACKAAGIGVRTFYSWLYRAESDGGLYAELKERVRWQAPQQRSGDKTNAETAQETA